MKKLVLAMACVLSLALLASCKQAASVQDVNVKNQESTAASIFYGDASFTASFVTGGTADGTTGVVPYIADTSATNKSVAYSNAKRYASIKWEQNTETVDTNVKTYTFELPVVYNPATNATTGTQTQLVYKTLKFNIAKLGDDYYADLTTDASLGDKVTKIEFSDGNPESSEFTIKSLGVPGTDRNGNALPFTVSLSNIKFTRK